MRIYFVGSHATGKTTLCRHVSKAYQVPMISEVARSVLAEMETSFESMRTNMDEVAEYQMQVFSRQVRTERMHEDRFVSDRAFDNLAYAADHTTIVSKMFSSKEFQDYMKWVADGGIVFFLRPHKSLLVEDGVRAGVDWDSVVRIDGMVKLLLELHNIDYLPIESVSMQERVRTVQFVLDRELRRAKRDIDTEAPEKNASKGPIVARELVQSMNGPVAAEAVAKNLVSS